MPSGPFGFVDFKRRIRARMEEEVYIDYRKSINLLSFFFAIDYKFIILRRENILGFYIYSVCRLTDIGIS